MGACGKIASVGSVQKKNEVLWVDGTGIVFGALGGFYAGLAVGAFVVSGPVGWGVHWSLPQWAATLHKRQGKLEERFSMINLVIKWISLVPRGWVNYANSRCNCLDHGFQHIDHSSVTHSEYGPSDLANAAVCY